MSKNARRQGIYWLLTIPSADYSPPETLPPYASFICGQLEKGGTTGYEHWQILVAFSSKQSLSGVKTIFGGTAHAELSRSSAAVAYCRKDDTAVTGTRFELGALPIRRNSKTDWDSVWESAKTRNLDAIPANIRVQSYGRLRQIAADFERVEGMERECFVYWGITGTGKSRLAWEQAGVDAYPKDPRTKFWDGYGGEENVVIDEFRGGIDISHLLRWLDRYPVRVEIKGSSRPLKARKIWITSNLDPVYWYTEIDSQTRDALMRRLNITHFSK